jgi:hypothetical protein
MPTTYEPITTTTLGSAVNTFTISSIPGTYTDLVLVLSSAASADTSQKSFLLRFNESSSNVYSRTVLLGDGTTASSSRETNLNNLGVGRIQRYTYPSLVIVNIFNYASSSVNKTVLYSTSSDAQDRGLTERGCGLWRDTSAITSITFINDGIPYSVGTTATLYGIKAA